MEQGDALEAQVNRLKAAGANQVISELITGRDTERPGIVKVLAMVKARKVKTLLITRVDRLSRDSAFGDQLVALCSETGVTIKALDGGEIESATPQGFFMARTMNTLADMESRMLSMRIKKQFVQYRAQGRHLRRRMVFGYTNGPDHKLAPHPQNWKEAQHVLDVLKDVGGFTAAVRTLASEKKAWVPAPQNLHQWFVNPIIRGHVGHLYDKTSGKGWNAVWKEIYYDQHEALISEADWSEMATMLRRRKNNFASGYGKSTAPAHGLTGLMRCASCGSTLRRNSSTGTAWWSCRYRTCDNRGRVKETIAQEWAIAEAIKAADQLALVLAKPPEISPAVAMKRRDLEAARSLAARNPSLLPMCESLEREIEAMIAPTTSTPDVALFKRALQDPDFYRNASAAEQRAIFSGVLLELQIGRNQLVVALPRSF